MSLGHHYYSKVHKYGFFLNQFKELWGSRSGYARGKKFLTAGNFLFLAIAFLLFIYFVVSAIAEIFNVLPLASWLSMAWNSIMGMTAADMVRSGETLLNEAARETTPRDVVSSGQQVLSSIWSVIMSLLDEALGIGLIFVAFIVRLIDQFVRPMAAFSWILLFSSLIPAIVVHL